VAGIYLDTDCILAIIKDSDWLKADVTRSIAKGNDYFTSILTVVECKLVISRELDRNRIFSIDEQIRTLNIQFLIFDAEVERVANLLMKKYEFLGIFDSLHAASSIVHELTMMSTDHIFPHIEELSVVDPRDN